MADLKLVYIDDEIDTSISKCLAYKYGDSYAELNFDCTTGYEYLLNSILIKEANIILIDSRLFENDRVCDKKFSGEEFKIILKRTSPFIEVIVITQNDDLEEFGTLLKYKKECELTSLEYYNSTLVNVIESAISNIEIYRKIANKLSQSEIIDKVLIDKVLNSIDGLQEYDDLKSTDIDEIIKQFKELKDKIDGK